METKNLLRITLLTGLFSVFLIPFFVADGMFFPFITGKNFAFRILIELLAGGTLILALRYPEYRPRFSWVGIAVLSLMAAAILATIGSVDPIKSFWSNFERMEGLIGTLHMGLWFFVVTILLSTEKLWERFLQTSLFASFCMSVYGILQVSGAFVINQGGIRVDGTFGNAIYMAVYMLFHVFIGLFLMMRWRGPRFVQYLYGLAIVLDAVALYYTATRSATLGLLGGLIVAALGIGLFDTSRPALRKWAIGVLVAIGLIVVGFVAVHNLPAVQRNPVLSRFATISATETTIKARFMIWGMAYEGFKEHPILGWGQENFSYVFNKYYNPQMYGQEQWFDRAHSEYIDWLVAGGVVAFAAFISLFALAFWAFFKGPGLTVAERSILIGLIAAYAFHSFFVFDNLVSSMYFFLILALAHSLTRRPLPSSIVLTRPVTGGFLWLTGAASVVLTCAAVWYLNVPGITTSHQLIDAISSAKIGKNSLGQSVQVAKDPKENLESFKTVALSGPLGRQEAIEQLFQATAVISANQNVSPDIRAGFIALAKERGLAMLAERPDDARLELFYGAFLDQAGAYSEALPHLLRAHELSPAKQWISFETAFNNYAQTGNLQKAVEVTRAAYELAPEFREARIFYASALIMNEQADEGEKLLTGWFGTDVIDDSRLLTAYVRAEEFDKVAAIWKMKVSADPDNIQKLVSYAVAQKESGNLPSAIATLRLAAQKAPQYREALSQVARELGGNL